MMREFELYNQLSPEQRSHLDHFMIINSIKNSTEKKFTNEEEDRLFNIINYSLDKNNNDISISTIADRIVQAYANNKVSLEALENSSAYEILNCVNWESFESLEEEYKEGEEENL